MRRYRVSYFFVQSVKGLVRNGVMSLASIAVLMSCLVVLGAFSMLVFNIDYNLEELGSLNEIDVFVELKATDEEIAAIEKQINSLDNVATVQYVSKEEAYESEKKKYSDHPELFSQIEEEDDVYPAMFRITYADNDRVSTLGYQLEHIEGIYKVNYRSDIATTIENVKNTVILVFTWFLALLLVVSVFVIINTIKLAVFSRRQEISIMRYVGATNWFIVLPFVFEGLLIGIISSVIAFFIDWYAYGYLTGAVIGDIQFLKVIPFGDIRLPILLAFVGIGIFTGVVGSVISLRKYLKA